MPSYEQLEGFSRPLHPVMRFNKGVEKEKKTPPCATAGAALHSSEQRRWVWNSNTAVGPFALWLTPAAHVHGSGTSAGCLQYFAWRGNRTHRTTKLVGPQANSPTCDFAIAMGTCVHPYPTTSNHECQFLSIRIWIRWLHHHLVLSRGAPFASSNL